jgi:hypothetical protein
MQLNVNVPKDREELLSELDRAAGEYKTTKSQLVLDAVERYLRDLYQEHMTAQGIDLPTFDLGVIAPLRRADLYEELEDRKLRS